MVDALNKIDPNVSRRQPPARRRGARQRQDDEAENDAKSPRNSSDATKNGAPKPTPEGRSIFLDIVG